MTSAVMFYPFAALAAGRGADLLSTLALDVDRDLARSALDDLGEGALEPVFGIAGDPDAFLAIRRDGGDCFELVVVALRLVRPTLGEARALRPEVWALAAKVCSLPVLRVDVGATWVGAPDGGEVLQ